MKTKVIKGKPIYLYKGRQYMDMPEGTIIKSIRYTAEENISYVKCKKPTILIELLCSIIIALCISINLSTRWGDDLIEVRYNSNAIYYNGSLYINITVDECIKDVTCRLYVEDECVSETVLDRGEILTCIEIPFSLKYDLEVSSLNIYGSEVSERYVINATIKQ